MSRIQPSRAVIKTARLNPINPEEAKALDHITKLEAEGYNFKEVIVDAINRCAGATPEMFTRDRDDQARRINRMIEETLQQFSQDLLSKIGTGKIDIGATPDDDEVKPNGLTAFARNFSRGLMERQQQTLGDEEDEG